MYSKRTMIVAKCIFLLCLFVPSSTVFSDSNIDAQFFLSRSENQCFFFNVKNSLTDVDVIVITSDETHLTDVDFFSPHDQQLLHSSKGLQFHSFAYPNISGTPHDIGYYQICVRSLSYSETKVSLHVSMHNDDGSSVDDAYLQKLPENIREMVIKNNFQLEVFDKITRQIEEKLKSVKAEQRIRSAIERIDRTHIEEAFEKVNKYGLMHTFVMIATALIQVAVIRSILSDSSKIGGFLRKPRLSHSY